jgi:NAD(P)-dependent dehydrogenase (short-subunit alcohol dehydrogenase family)
VKARKIRGSTIVIVGATSGVGRATALSLATLGAQLVVVARTSDAVAAVAEECRHRGAPALGVVADISRPDDVDRIVTRATERFGGIDTWINTAAALVVGDLTAQPPDEIASLVATNVLGTTLASRAAMRHFRSRNAGVLINTSSLLGVVPNPVVPTYSMSKFAVRGLTLSLHQSTWRRSPIRACVILPGPIDTPLFARAANHTGRPLRAIPPAFSAERVAAAVIRSVRRPRRQRTTGLTGALIVLGLHVLPRFTETFVAQVAARLVFRPGTAPITRGALDGANVPSTSSGDWRRGPLRVRLGDAVGRASAVGLRRSRNALAASALDDEVDAGELEHPAHDL